MVQVLQQLVFGVVTGSYIALAAIGFTLVYGLVDMINFAHGELMTIGAYIGLVATRDLGLSIPLAIVPVLVGTAVAGWLVAEVFFEPLDDAGAIPLLLTSIGVGLILRNGMRLTLGADPQYFETGTVASWRFESLNVFVSSQQLLVVAAALVAVAALHLFLTRTRMGVAMRATADNEDLALVTGINTSRVRTVVWLLASGLAGVSGLLLGVSRSVNPSLGFGQILLVLTAAILGGAGSPYGAIVGSYVLGIGIALAVAFLPTAATSLSVTMAFAVLIVVLLVKPGGITGQEVRV